MRDEEALALANSISQVLTLEQSRLGDEYYYHSLPLCVIDAVFSIGVQYAAVRKTVARYCSHFSLPMFRADRGSPPSRDEQQSVTLFLQSFQEKGLEAMTTSVFGNRQRTSSRNGILKADAVFQFASVLQRNHVEHLQDMESKDSALLEPEIRKIRGQGSGLSFQYFRMLAGSDSVVKPDRMILRFLESALGRPIAVAEAQPLLVSAIGYLRQSCPEMTPRLLDHEIWKHQRGI